jgi:hypothetical protein
MDHTNLIIEWDSWERAKSSARWGLYRTLSFRDTIYHEDLVEEIALRLLIDGWNVKWRVVDVLRIWYGRYNRTPTKALTREQIQWNSNGSYFPSPEVAAQIKERRQGKPLCTPIKKEPDYKIATSKESFARRWI